MKRVQATISGRVQGVGFRRYAEDVAGRLMLVGTVRNLPAGEVEAIAEGEEETLRLFVDALQQGPSSSRVEHLHAAWADPLGQFTEFRAVS